uniref:Homeobox domain-containing protein n=1 Tax=Rhabditophanes sp. KR3021 TaxID=114890 RepID=A0AC35U4T0_9BILA
MDKINKRRLRTNFTEAQSLILEEAFLETHYPDHDTKKSMAKTLQIPEDRITIWFQNRRSKWRRNECREKPEAPPALIKPNLSLTTSMPSLFKTSLKELCSNIGMDTDSLSRELAQTNYPHFPNTSCFISNTPATPIHPAFGAATNYQNYHPIPEDLSSINSSNPINKMMTHSPINSMPYPMTNSSQKMVFNYNEGNCFF